MATFEILYENPFSVTLSRDTTQNQTKPPTHNPSLLSLSIFTLLIVSHTLTSLSLCFSLWNFFISLHFFLPPPPHFALIHSPYPVNFTFSTPLSLSLTSHILLFLNPSPPTLRATIITQHTPSLAKHFV